MDKVLICLAVLVVFLIGWALGLEAGIEYKQPCTEQMK